MKKKYPSTPMASSGSSVISGFVDDFEEEAARTAWISAGLDVMGILGPETIAK
jgi:hypothetical protein